MAAVPAMAARQEMLPLERKCALILSFISIYNNIQAIILDCFLSLRVWGKDVYCKMAPQKYNLTVKKRHLVVIIKVKKDKTGRQSNTLLLI